ncbi:MAG: bifunctional nicotinamidase/pyrazinamidase [Promethearchaeota archaeon]
MQIKYERNIQINKKDALIIVDIQNDFLPGGALAVNEGDLIIDDINKLAQKFKDNKVIIVLTQDWHPKNHLSFASNHKGKKPGDEYTSKNGAIGPVLWPDHCIQGTNGAKFHKDLNTQLANKIIQKGIRRKVDSYSGFRDNDKKTETGLRKYLNSKKIQRIFICGLALDYCCYYTAMDGLEFGYEVYFIERLTRGVDLPEGNINNALSNMKKSGITFADIDSFK